MACRILVHFHWVECEGPFEWLPLLHSPAVRPSQRTAGGAGETTRKSIPASNINCHESGAVPLSIRYRDNRAEGRRRMHTGRQAGKQTGLTPWFECPLGSAVQSAKTIPAKQSHSVSTVCAWQYLWGSSLLAHHHTGRNQLRISFSCVATTKQDPHLQVTPNQV